MPPTTSLHFTTQTFILIKFSFCNQSLPIYIQLPTINNRYKISNILYLYSNIAKLRNSNLSIPFCSYRYVIPDIINIQKLTQYIIFQRDLSGPITS